MPDVSCFTMRSANGLHSTRVRERVPLLLYRAQVSRRIGYLLAADAGVFSINGHAGPGLAITVRLDFDADPARTELVDALSAHHRLSMDAANQSGSEPAGPVFRRRGRDPGQSFLLDAVPAADVPDDTARLARELSDAIAVPMDWRQVLQRVRAGHVRAALAEPLLRLLSFQELSSLARHLIESPSDLALLAAAMPDNPWFGQRLPGLAAWIGAREHPACPPEPAASGTPTPWLKTLFSRRAPTATAPGAAPPESRRNGPEHTHDLPGCGGAISHRPDLGLSLTAMARAQTRPRSMACVVACARNEGPYLLDWIAYHRSIGFDHIFLYTNDNTDGSDELLGLLAQAGEITWFRNDTTPGTLPQFRAYAHALSVMPDILDYQWTLICDLDEYFGFDTQKFVSAPDFLEWQDLRKADAVALPWLIHVADARDSWRDTPVVRRLPQREATVNHHVKTVFRTHMMWGANPHHPDAIPGLRMQFLAETGLQHNPLPPDHNPSLSHNPVAANAWIAHYIFRTAPELLQKIRRGRGDLDNRIWDKAARQQVITTFMRLTTACQLVHDPRTQRCAGHMEEWLARLQRIRGVTSCDAAIKRRFRIDMSQDCAKFLAEPVESGEPAECMEFRAILGDYMKRSAAA